MRGRDKDGASLSQNCGVADEFRCYNRAMTTFLGLSAFAAALAVFFWMASGSRRPGGASVDSIIDPNDSRQIGMIMGMAGGDIADAATVRYALQRFKEQHGRDATTREIGFVIGMMRSMK
jgi:hypothetical protein